MYILLQSLCLLRTSYVYYQPFYPSCACYCNYNLNKSYIIQLNMNTKQLLMKINMNALKGLGKDESLTNSAVEL